MAEVKVFVSKRSLEIRGLDEVLTREEFVAAFCIALGKLKMGGLCRLYKSSNGVQTTVVQQTGTHALRLLQLRKVKVGWIKG